MEEKKKDVENLVWKASQLPLKFKFISRDVIHQEIAGLQEKWKNVKSSICKTNKGYMNINKLMIDIKVQLEDIEKWVLRCQQLLNDYEEHYLEKDLKAIHVLQVALQVDFFITTFSLH